MKTVSVVEKPAEISPVPNGASTGIFDWVGRLFVPDNVEQDWIRNDAEIRMRSQNDASSKDIQARIASDPKMAKSAENIRVYTSAPFVGDVLDGSTIAEHLATSALEAPRKLITTATEAVVDPLAGAVKKTVQTIIPWQLWLIVGAAVVGGVLVLAYAKGKS